MTPRIFSNGLLIVLSFVTAISAEAASCMNGETRYSWFSRWVYEKASYSVTGSSPMNLKFTSCRFDGTVAKLKLAEAGRLSFRELRGENAAGNPAFELCRLLAGEAQKIELKISGKWLPTSRCLFGDGSFVDLNQLSEKIRKF